MADNFFLPKPALTKVPEDFLRKAAMVKPLAGQMVSRGGGLPWVAGGLRIKRRKKGKGRLF